MKWKYLLAPPLALLAIPFGLLYIFVVLFPCELMWIALTLLGEEERGDAFMEFATSMGGRF